MCGTDTEWEDGFVCRACDAWWPERSCYDEPGQWSDPVAEQCPYVVKPFEHNEFVADDKPFKHEEFRCWRDSGHGADHIHPELVAYRDGWQIPEAATNGGDQDG